MLFGLSRSGEGITRLLRNAHNLCLCSLCFCLGSHSWSWRDCTDCQQLIDQFQQLITQLTCQGCQTRTKPNARPDSGSNRRLYYMAVRGTTGVGQSRADVGVVQRSRQGRGRGAGVGQRRADVDGGGGPRWRRADVDGDWSGRGYLDNRQRQT